MRYPPGLTLFIDADDTLWENNVHFNAVMREYARLLELHGIDPQRAHDVLLDVERRRTKTHGYGIACFRLSLGEACHALLGREPEEERRVLDALCTRLARFPIDVLADVPATLRELRGRHRVILMTKGDRDDQLDKLMRSSLHECFHQVDVVREKDVDTYRLARDRFGVCDGRGWMVGNSPRSDIRPALEAGLNAVFVPHKDTWVLEHEDLPTGYGERLLTIESFGDLVASF